MDDFKRKSPELYNYFYDVQTEITDIFLQETQQQDPFVKTNSSLETKQKPP